MLSEPGASRSGNSGLVSSAKRRYLKLVHRKIPVSEHRSRTRELKSVHYTYRPIPDVVHRSRGPFTDLCRAEEECKSAKVTLSPAKTTALHFAPMLVREKRWFWIASTKKKKSRARARPRSRGGRGGRRGSLVSHRGAQPRRPSAASRTIPEDLQMAVGFLFLVLHKKSETFLKFSFGITRNKRALLPILVAGT